MQSKLFVLVVMAVVFSIIFWNCRKNAPTENNNSNFVKSDSVQVFGGIFHLDTTIVTVSSFKIDKYEVTFELWTEVRNWGLTHGYSDLPAGQNGYNPVGPNNAVVKVSWYDVVKWCNARSEKDVFTPVYYTDNLQATLYRTGQIDINNDALKWTANGYRLPTECEWEFAAQGGTLSQEYYYSGSNDMDFVGWDSDNSGRTTHTVGQKAANELGIYDMSGDVWEWCWDWYDVNNPYFEENLLGGMITDPRGPSKTVPLRVSHGGSCFNIAEACSVRWLDEGRIGAIPGDRSSVVQGFRCVQTK